MEQIYYTQCPIGYGLGASNGYQVKRISPGYPASADFRHLGMRATLPGSRGLAPPALRYRRDGDAAELAWLTPRDREFETEKGRWGRPGGHFAHGVRLDGGEFRAISQWPAGLIDSPAWRRSDPEPSRGRAPEPIRLGPEAMTVAPTFAAVAALARGIDPHWMATALGAIAEAVVGDQAVYLIGEAADIPRRIALLTFAFPEPLRGELTFSTYHDRPEELTGFRIQGLPTVAVAGRGALSSSGIVADLATGRFDPHREAPAWAATLARWFSRADREAEASWQATNRRAMTAAATSSQGMWSHDWLTSLIDLEAMLGAADGPLETPEAWSRLVHLAMWSTKWGLAKEWNTTFSPQWWRDRAEAGRSLPEARKAFCTVARQPSSWSISRPEDWGHSLAAWFGDRPAVERQEAIAAAWKGSPAAARKGLLASILAAFPVPAAEDTLHWLRESAALDPSVLLPLEARLAARSMQRSRDAGSLAEIFALAGDDPQSLIAALEAVAAELEDDRRAIALAASALADALESPQSASQNCAIAWCLERPDAGAWLGPLLARTFAGPTDREAWAQVRDRTADGARPALARALLDSAISDEAFAWGVEEILLPIDPALRPHDPAWPDAYLRRSGSGLDLFRKLYVRGVQPALKAWIAGAAGRGEVSAQQADRLRSIRSFARALASQDARSLLSINLPEVPPGERGAMLGQMLGHLRDSSPGATEICLQSCRAAWPGAFEPGAEGLQALARPIADALARSLAEPKAWIDSLRRVVEGLGLAGDFSRGFEPDGLAAEVVAASNRLAESGRSPWILRQSLFRHDRGWRLLAADARRDLEAIDPARAPEVFDLWDSRIDQGGQTARFFELMLNACPTAAGATIAAARARDLATLGRLPWWDFHRVEGGEDDRRDAFARTSPMDPLPEESLPFLHAWMTPGALSDGLVPLESDLASSGRGQDARISPAGLDRWRCLSALGAFSRSGIDSGARWDMVASWRGRISLRALSENEAYHFLAWVISRLDVHDDASVAGLADWLISEGIGDPARVSRWADELTDVGGSARLARVALVSDLAAALRGGARAGRDRGAKNRPPGSPRSGDPGMIDPA